jgi:hypothetical protein
MVRETDVQLVYASRLVPADELDRLTGLVNVGGDALLDSETLYDPDWNWHLGADYRKD